MAVKKNRVNRAKRKVSKKVKSKRALSKEKFLKQLETMPIIQVAASQTDIHRSTYYRWYEEDEDFRERADEALKTGQKFINDMMESMLIKLAKEGKVTPMIFWLKHHHPQYMEIRRYEHFHQHKFEQQPLTEERKREIAACVEAWAKTPDEDADEEDEDYEIDEEDPSRQ